MRIINRTRDTTLAESVIIADTPFRRMKGLLGRKEFSRGAAIVLCPCNSVHTLFMRFPIDIAFIDKDHRVVKILSSLKPFRVSAVYLRASCAIEFPAGVLTATNTGIGDIVLPAD